MGMGLTEAGGSWPGIEVCFVHRSWSSASRRRWLAVAAAAVGLGVASPIAARATVLPSLAPVPRAQCGPGSDPETGMQGRVTTADVSSGRAGRGYRCNTVVVGHYGTVGTTGAAGGYRVYRYVDKAGHECGFYDSTLL